MDSTDNTADMPSARLQSDSPPRAADGRDMAVPVMPPASRSQPRNALIAIAALVTLSAVFVAFAGGMLFQRFVVANDAQAAQGAAPDAFDRAWELVHTRYVDPSVIDDEAMLESAIDGMLQTLKDEGHTRYLTAEEAHAESQNLAGEYVGVGIQVDMRDEQIVVVAPIDESPAMEAGIQPGDVLVGIDGLDVRGQTVDQVIDRIRGEEGTQVTLRFEREGEATPLEYTLTRRKIEVSSVSWTMLEDGNALLRLSQFTSGSGDDLAQALNEAQEAGADSIVLDLRNNPGGYINEAEKIGSMFVPEGETIFISQVRDGSQTPHAATEQPVHIGDLPLVVLINEGSASSSEIVSGAIKANNPNATVIGETTFGTGTVLSSFGLGDGSSVLLGTELWLTPDGKLIKNQGIKPDVLVGLPEDQVPFSPIDNAETQSVEIEDHQLDWAIHVVESGQAGEVNPTWGTPGDRSQ